MESDKYGATTAAEVTQSQSLKAVGVVHNLINQLEDKLLPVLRPSIGAKETATPEPVQSELMQELAYLQSRLNALLERLHV